MVKKVYVSKPWASGARALFGNNGFDLVETPEECDIIVFNGGEDISPALYKQEPIDGCGVYFDQSRDDIELDEYSRARKAFKFGICRGGQLLNVLNGGRLWQDVDNHDGDHQMIEQATGRRIWTSSIHHQMFMPGPTAEVVCVAYEANHKIGIPPGTRGLKPVQWRRSSFKTYAEDPEVVWYPKDRALCIQGHPEYRGYSELTDYCFELLERYY